MDSMGIEAANHSPITRSLIWELYRYKTLSKSLTAICLDLSIKIKNEVFFISRKKRDIIEN
jgi:hypothetical protein